MTCPAGKAQESIKQQLEHCDEVFEALETQAHHCQQSWDVARQNQAKNIYSDAYPLQSHAFRFISNPDRYINASEFSLSDLNFIACQAPLLTTIDDFWDMCFQASVQTIISLTPFDNGAVHPFQTSNSTVSISKGQNPNTFQVTRSQTTRIFTHHHYKAWPNYGVPSDLDLVTLIRTLLPQTQHPILVHCRGGFGRTGTFLAALAAVHQISNQKPCNLASIVQEIRSKRHCYAVEGKAQFAFLHHLVLQAIADLFG